MKTLTEFSGSTIRGAAEARGRLATEGVAAEQMTERLGTELAVSGDKLARLVEALEAVGDKAERVRLVRVFAAEEQPPGAKKIGEFNYVIDLQPDMRALPGRSEGRRGGRDGGRGRGPGGPGG